MAKNAPAASARAGWQYFKDSEFKATHERVNAQLEKLGLPVVSERMYGHYRKLGRAGYDHYVTINRFDVAKATKPFEDETGRLRNVYRSANLAVRLVTRDKDGEPRTATGTAMELSEAGALVRVRGKQADALNDMGLRQGDYIRVEISGPEGASESRIVSAEYQPAVAVFEIEFVRVRSVAEDLTETAVSAERVKIRMVTDTDGIPIPVDVLGARLYHLFELLEDSRAVVNEILMADEREREKAQPAHVETLSVTSPLEIVAVVSIGVAAVIGHAWKGAGVYERWQAANGLRAAARKTDAEAHAIELENQRTAQENLTYEVIHAALRERLDLANASPELKPSIRALALLDKNLRSASEGLARNGVSDLIIEAQESEEDEH